ncbi:MAG: translational machinery protein [Devosia sp.]
MTIAHACVWIDHREAKIFGLSRDQSEEVTVHDHHAPKHIHRKADHVHQCKAAPDHAFFDDVAAQLLGFKGIVIVGPGTARSEFAGHLAERYPQITKRVWGIEAMDHPTEPQIIAAARKFFHAADQILG